MSSCEQLSSGEDPPRIVNGGLGAFLGRDGLEDVVIHQHDEHAAFFQRVIDIDQAGAAAVEFLG